MEAPVMKTSAFIARLTTLFFLSFAFYDASVHEPYQLNQGLLWKMSQPAKPGDQSFFSGGSFPSRAIVCLWFGNSELNCGVQNIENPRPKPRLGNQVLNGLSEIITKG